MVSLPPEVLAEARLSEGSEVHIRNETGQVILEPVAPAPPDDLLAFAERFMGRYESAFRELSDK
jgi:antitoxin component of MazEF toxin-antitoxin module